MRLLRIGTAGNERPAALVGDTAYVDLSDVKNFASRGPLAKALEDLFQNITLNLLSEQYLQ